MGSSSTTMMRRPDAPAVRAAATYSALRSERYWPSTSRATSIQQVAEIRMVVETMPGLTSMARARIRKIVGKASMASTKRISKAPTKPRR
ncbi:hypothetical protein D3C71_1685100 [compost metagenome]